jgi:hypothetical protein
MLVEVGLGEDPSQSDRDNSVHPTGFDGFDHLGEGALGGLREPGATTDEEQPSHQVAVMDGGAQGNESAQTVSNQGRAVQLHRLDE